MEKQIKLYSISLGLTINEEEKVLVENKKELEKESIEIKKALAKEIRSDLKLKSKEWNQEASEKFKERIKKDQRHSKLEKDISNIKKQLRNLYKENVEVRKVETVDFTRKNNIAFFESDLTRTLNLLEDATTLDFIVIEAKKQDYTLLKQVIVNGLYIDGVEYQFFSAGAGHIRKQKFLMIKKAIWDKYEKTLLCGLTVEEINNKGSININKYLAYLSLLMTASKVKTDFDIDKCIVVDDYETFVNAEVDYINIEEFEEKKEYKINEGTEKEAKRTKKIKKAKWTVTPDIKDILIPHSDGAGLCLPSFSNGLNIQFRMPWFKGLLTPVNWKAFLKEHKLKDIEVKDIWGKSHNIIKEDIQVIFTKSQFKLWKFYTDEQDEENSWENYKAKFKEFNRTFNICKVDSKYMKDYKNMEINYQMCQTLDRMSDEDIDKMMQNTKDLINKVHYDRHSQLEFLGATLKNDKRDNFQECLRLYPELLSSAYVRGKLSDSITSIKKKAKSARIKLDARRTFILPDVVAWMEWLFLGIDKPEGVLKADEVYCSLFKKSKRLAVLRSPHLSREWCIRKNIASKNKLKYFDTYAIYTSSHDLISKILMFDVDGDEAHVVSDKEKWLLDLAEEQMKDIRPLYYEMGKAGAKEINLENIYNSLKYSFKSTSIGKVSNTITNIWNTFEDDKMELIKKMTAYNNFVIDSAKTLEIPLADDDMKEAMKVKKFPYFFQWAKDERATKCFEKGNGVIDRFCNSIEDIKYQNFDYSNGFGSFRLSNLMNNYKIEIDEDVINHFLAIEKATRKRLGEIAVLAEEDEDIFKMKCKESIYDDAKKLIIKYCNSRNLSLSDVTDMIVKYLFKEESLKMAFMFEVLGDVILENLNKNIKKSIDEGYELCNICGKRFKQTNNNHKQCNVCEEKQKNA